jgi:uroporphyrinogen decarboxylase
MSASTRFIDACYRRPTDCTPVWLMRQAGRYQASYRAIRARTPFFTLCKTPELAARVTVNAVEELGVDAAILFSDILIAVESMGAAVSLTEEGPRLDSPIRDSAAVDALAVPDPSEAIPFVMEAIRLVRTELAGRVPLIGFAGAPLTLASYLVEGGGSKSYPNTRALFFGEPRVAHCLMDKLCHTVASQLRFQVEAGCQAVQLFDSWAGIFGPDDYRAFALPYNRRIVEELAGSGVPRIIFATGAGTFLDALEDTGADVVGLDWRTDLAGARRQLGPDTPVQGNLDPGCLFLDEADLEARVKAILDAAGSGGGHIFNLGHGVLPQTPERRVRFLVETVHRLSARGAEVSV